MRSTVAVDAAIAGEELDDVEAELLMNAGYPREKDKLGGWPYWMQSVSCPACPECTRPMRPLFQLDSNGERREARPRTHCLPTVTAVCQHRPGSTERFRLAEDAAVLLDVMREAVAVLDSGRSEHARIRAPRGAVDLR
jgi:hypothetical protein